MGHRRLECEIGGIACWAWSSLPRLRRTRSDPCKAFAMSRMAALLLSLGPAKLVRRKFDLDPRTVLLIINYLQSPFSYVDFSARFQLPYQLATSVTDWALPQRRAAEFFVTLTIVLGYF